MKMRIELRCNAVLGLGFAALPLMLECHRQLKVCRRIVWVRGNGCPELDYRSVDVTKMHQSPPRSGGKLRTLIPHLPLS